MNCSNRFVSCESLPLPGGLKFRSCVPLEPWPTPRLWKLKTWFDSAACLGDSYCSSSKHGSRSALSSYNAIAPSSLPLTTPSFSSRDFSNELKSCDWADIWLPYD